MSTFRPPHRELAPATFLLAASTALAFSPDAYLPMLARAFLVQWALGFCALALLLAWKRRPWTAVAALIGCALVLPQTRMTANGSTGEEGVPRLRIAHMNVLLPNARFAEAIEGALASGADLISVQEVDAEWTGALLAGLGERYPHVRLEPREDCYGIALFSRLPFLEARTVEMLGVPFIEVLVDLDGEPVRVVAAHITSPISHAHFRRRNGQLAGLAAHVAATDTPTVVVGDLNTVHWDGAFRRFCARSGLRSATTPVLRTWPSLGPIALIPLDHLLLSGGLTHAAVSVFPVPGSDHRGLLADIQFLPRAR